MPTAMDEMCETLHVASHGGGLSRSWAGLPPETKTAYRLGLAAVISKHFEPMIAEAFAAGDRKISGYGETPEGYAARIITTLIGDGE